MCGAARLAIGEAASEPAVPGGGPGPTDTAGGSGRLMAGRTIMLVAGEASGDRHGAGLMAEIRRQRPGVRLTGMGGQRMLAAGLEPLVRAPHYRSGLSVEADARELLDRPDRPTAQPEQAPAAGPA